MKKLFGLCLTCILLFAYLPAQAEKACPIAVTFYRQVGWGDSVQIGYIDENGSMWYIEGYDHDLNWPYEVENQLEWLSSAKNPKLLGTLEHDAFFILNSLVECVEVQNEDLSSAADDAGTEKSYAVRYSGDEAEIVTLGVSGDYIYENMDASAQALYLYLRQSFPGVTSYFGHKGMGPMGFQPVSLMEFCGYGDADISSSNVTRQDIGCEASTEPISLDEDEADSIRSKILNADVVGKQSCIVTTGGSVCYTFTDESGKTLAAFELFHGLLVMRDGMYFISD